MFRKMAFSQSTLYNQKEDTFREAYLYPKPWPLLDLTLKYVLNNDVCGKAKVSLLVLVTSHPGESLLRRTLRQDFNQSELVRLRTRRVFMLAKLDPNPKSDQSKYHNATTKEIETENAQHSDIIQGNFTEHYHNLTYKHFMGLEWASRFCPQATFVLKQDDDIFVDIFGLLQRLRSTSLGYTLRTTPSIYGNLMSGGSVHRDPKSKWYVKPSEYDGDTYPNYVSGGAYLTTHKVIMSILDVGHKHKYFWVDDVHITGTLRLTKFKNIEYATGTKIVEAPFFFGNSKELECCLTVRQSQNNYINFWSDCIIGPNHPTTSHLSTDLLNQSRTCYATQTCKLRAEAEAISLLQKCFTTTSPPEKPTVPPPAPGKPAWEWELLALNLNV